MSEDKRKSGRFSVPVRITAGVLAAIMILSVALYNRSGVTMKSDGYSEKDLQIAARELLKDNTYANDSRVGQMMTYVRNLLSGHRSYEDIELGVQISIAQGMYDEAISLTQQSVSLYEGDSEGLGRLYLRLGYLYVMKNDPENALVWLDRGIALAPSPEAYLTRAQLELDMGETEKALADRDRYLETAKNSDEMLADLVNIYEATGDYETAVDMLTKLIGEENNSEYLLHRAYSLTNLGRMEEAAEDRNRYAAAGGTELGSADVMLGIGWMRAKEYALADDCFIRAIGENYSDPESLYFYVVLCAYMTENYERVCAYGDQLIERIRSGVNTDMADFSVEKRTGQLNISLVKMDLASLYQMNGASHLYMGHYEQAAERLTDCLAVKPGSAYVCYLRGVCFLALERYPDAIADFDTAIAADTETEKSYYSRALCRMETGDTAGAMEDFEWVVLNGRDRELYTEAANQISRLLNAPSGEATAETGSP